MRICLVSQEYPSELGGGGIGTQTLMKARGLVARGHQVHVLTSSPDESEWTRVEDGAVVHRIGEPQLDVGGYEPQTYWLAYSAAVARRLGQLEDEVGFDVIQFPEYGGEGFVHQADTFTWRRARYVVQLHGPLAMFAERMGWPERGSAFYETGSFMERMSIRLSDLVLASSAVTAAFCADFYGYPLDQISVVHSGVDTAAFAPRPQPPDAAHPRILFVGNLVANKGIFHVGAAVARLRRRYPQIRLRAIGRGDGDEAARLADVLGKAIGSLELLGYVARERLLEHYAWCDMLVAPSQFEGGPGNVCLEAMACGRPVVASTAGGVCEAVVAEQTGVLIEPGDVDAIAAAIVRLAEDHELRAAFGRAARARAEREFSLDRYVDRIEQLYQQVTQVPLTGEPTPAEQTAATRPRRAIISRGASG